VLVPSELLAELSLAGGVRGLDHPLISRDGRIEEILGITEREKAELQTVWRESRKTLRETEATAAVVEELEDGSARLTLPDLSTQRQAAAHTFFSSVKGILGDNRGEAFLAVKQAQAAFAPHGEDWSCTISPESIGDGRWRFRMAIEDAGQRRVWVGETIPNELRHLTDAAHIVPSLEEETP
jgi:hypothetical protein